MKAVFGVLLFAAFLVSSCVPASTESIPAQDNVPETEDVQLPAPVEEFPPPPDIVPVPDTVLVPVVETAEPEPDYPFIGEADAPVTVVSYADFSSEPGSRFHFWQIASLKRDYVQTGKVKLVIIPYALSDKGSKAAEAAFCMWEQGSKQFWSYADTLHIFFSHLEASSLVNYADRVPNADKAAIKTCLDEGRYSSAVNTSLESGKAAGIIEVPAVSINGEVFAGDISYAELKSAIDAQLKKESGTASLASITGFVFSVPELISQLIG